MQVLSEKIQINTKEMFKFFASSLKARNTSSTKPTNDEATNKFLAANVNDAFDTSSVPTEAGQVLKHSVDIFGKRLCTNLVFKVIFSINGSLEMTCRYFEAAAGFIAAVCKQQAKIRTDSLCPFQVLISHILYVM